MTFCRPDDNKYNICQMATKLQMIYMVRISKEVHSSSFKASLTDGNVDLIDVVDVDVVYDVISRPGPSRGLLYKQPRHSFIH